MNVILDTAEIQQVVAAAGQPFTIRVKGAAHGPNRELVMMFEGEVQFRYVAGMADGILKGLGPEPQQTI